jgi:hypothetical protein
MDESSDNILGVDFIQMHRLYYNNESQQIKFLTTPSKPLCSMKKAVIPAL